MGLGIFHDIDYAAKLSEEDRKWLYKALVGMRSADINVLRQIANEDAATNVWAFSKSLRTARYNCRPPKNIFSDQA